MRTFADSHVADKHKMSKNEESDRLLVGVQAMADEVGQPVRRVRHWIRTGRIRCVNKLGNLHTAGRNALRRELGLD
jgi:hypothetical protein